MYGLNLVLRWWVKWFIFICDGFVVNVMIKIVRKIMVIEYRRDINGDGLNVGCLNKINYLWRRKRLNVIFFLFFILFG